MYVPTYLPMYVPTYVPTYVPMYLPTYLPTYLYREQNNENEISPIKPTSITRIQAWICRVFRNSDYIQEKAQRVEQMEKTPTELHR